MEAFLVGLNHEMGRELLWRRFPTDQRGSCFRTFWNRGARAGASGVQTPRDIAPIAGWRSDSALGTHAPEDAEGDPHASVFLIRGDLLQRYPRAAIYLQRAAWMGGVRVLSHGERQPSFHLAGPPGIVMIGFNVAPGGLRGADDATGDAGWFFVIRELPGEPRFGLDAASGSFGRNPACWRDLRWSDVAADETALRTMRYLPLEAKAQGMALPLAGPQDTTTGTWGACSAEIALITQQLPARLVIHARSWISAG